MSGGVLLFLLPGLHSLRLKSPPCALCRQVDIFAGSYALGLKRFPVYFFRIKPVFRLFRRFFRIAYGNDCYGEHRFRHTELFTQVVNDHRHRRRTAKQAPSPLAWQASSRFAQRGNRQSGHSSIPLFRGGNILLRLRRQQ